MVEVQGGRDSSASTKETNVISAKALMRSISSISDEPKRLEVARHSFYYLLATGQIIDSLVLLKDTKDRVTFPEGERNKILNGILETAMDQLNEDPLQTWQTIASVVEDIEAPEGKEHIYLTKQECEDLDREDVKDKMAATLGRLIECYLNPDIQVKNREYFALYDLEHIIQTAIQGQYLDTDFKIDFWKVFDSLSESAREKLLAGDYLPDHVRKTLEAKSASQPAQATSDVAQAELPWEELSIEEKIQRAIPTPFDPDKNPFDGLERQEIRNKLCDALDLLGALAPNEVEKLKASLAQKGFLHDHEVAVPISTIKDSKTKMQAIRMAVYANLAQSGYDYFAALQVLDRTKAGLLPVQEFGKERKDMVKTIVEKSLADNYGTYYGWNIMKILIIDKSFSYKEILTEEEYVDIDTWFEERAIAAFKKQVLERIKIINDVSRAEEEKSMRTKWIQNDIDFTVRYNYFERIWNGLDRDLQEAIAKICKPPEGYQPRAATPAAPVVAGQEQGGEVPRTAETTAEKLTRLINANFSEEQEREALVETYSRAKKMVDENKDKMSTFVKRIFEKNPEAINIELFRNSWMRSLVDAIENKDAVQDQELKARFLELYLDTSLIFWTDHDYSLPEAVTIGEEFEIARLPLQPEYGNFLYENIYSRLLNNSEFVNAFRFGAFVVDKSDKILRPEENTAKIKKEWIGRMGTALKEWSDNIVNFEDLGSNAIFPDYCDAFKTDHPKEFSQLYKTFNAKTQTLLKESGLAPQSLIKRVLRR